MDFGFLKAKLVGSPWLACDPFFCRRWLLYGSVCCLDKWYEFIVLGALVIAGMEAVVA